MPNPQQLREKFVVAITNWKSKEKNSRKNLILRLNL
jgi:hypothetical protein